MSGDNNELWGRYPFHEGMEVVHVLFCKNGMNIDEVPIMTIQKLLKKQKDPTNKDSPTIMHGIAVKWFSKDHKIQKDSFHSKELIPKAIAMEGIDEINKWINR